ARMALKKLPKGKFFAEEWMDDDGLSGDPVYVCVSVTVDENEFLVDYTGSSPEVPGPINCTITRFYSAARSLFKAITDPKTPANEGWFRPVRVRCPPGTVFTARRPAPVSTYWETGAYACDRIWRALFPALSDRLTAGHSLSVCGTIVSGKDDGTTFILVEPQAGGWGAGATKDGESGLVVVGDGETYIMPVEICESRFPIKVEQYSFNVKNRGTGLKMAKQGAGLKIAQKGAGLKIAQQGAGLRTAKQGAGRQRGGFGLIRDYRILCDHASLTTTFGRHKYPPWGADGGEDGSSNGVSVFRCGETEPSLWSGKLARYPLNKGDMVRLVTGCGGGVGHPGERDPEEVLRDVKNDFLTVEDARDIYKVSIDSNTLQIDQLETKNLRK
ncbi:MAG: hydantoinase B/oxoprolinase family protein, partial [Spirochaetota bacterium]